MLWVWRDIEVEQIPIQSSDLTAATLRLADRNIIMVSVYVEGYAPRTLKDTVNKLNGIIRQHLGSTGIRTDVILVGNFNRHDHLWGGDEVNPKSKEKQTQS
jgi:hypothetical protein